jgi:hypothetical protein
MLKLKSKNGIKCSTCATRLDENMEISSCYECKLSICENCFKMTYEKQEDTRYLLNYD